MICPIKLFNSKNTNYDCETECALFDKNNGECTLYALMSFAINYLYNNGVLLEEMAKTSKQRQTRVPKGH